MQQLEDAVDPRKLSWLGKNLHAVSAFSKAELYERNSRLVATCHYRTSTYVREVLSMLAHASARDDAPFPFAVKRHHVTSKTSVDFDADVVAALEKSIRIGTVDVNVYRMYCFYHVSRYFRSLQHMPMQCERAEPEQVQRLKTLLAAFAKETTYKVHGDKSLHAEIITCLLSPFLSAMMADLETPYQLVALAFPSQVNDMVRPMLQMPSRDRIALVKWHGPHQVRDVIVAAGLLVELIGQKRIGLLHHGNLTRGSMDTPLMYMRRKVDGSFEVGVRHQACFHRFDRSLSVCDILIAWVGMLNAHQIDGTGPITNLFFGTLSDVNPLWKYLQASNESDNQQSQ